MTVGLFQTQKPSHTYLFPLFNHMHKVDFICKYVFSILICSFCVLWTAHRLFQSLLIAKFWYYFIWAIFQHNASDLCLNLKWQNKSLKIPTERRKPNDTKWNEMKSTIIIKLTLCIWPPHFLCLSLSVLNYYNFFYIWLCST